MKDLEQRRLARTLLKMGKISGVSGLNNASKLVAQLSNKYVDADMVKTGFLPNSSIRTFDILFTATSYTPSTDISWMQALLPAHTAAFSVNPIGGSVTSQIQYANFVNTVRYYGSKAMPIPGLSPVQNFVAKQGIGYLVWK